MEKKYSIIYDALLRRIKRGTYPEENMIPTERELTQEFSVTRNTVRRAIEELINEGYLYRKPGSGAFVCAQPVQRSLQRMSVRSDQDMRKRFKKLTIRVLNFEVVSGTDIQKNVLGLKSSARIYHLQRVQYGDGKPIVYESIYLPCKYFTKIPKEECTHSINDIVNTHAQFNSSLRRNRIVIEAKAATKSTSSYLAIPINSPLLKLKMTVMVNETPYYYGSAYYPGNEYNFVAEE